MPLLPAAYAASLVRHDGAGRIVFCPVSHDKSSYIVPDVETGRRIILQLERIRIAQLTAWALLPIILMTTLAVTDGIGVLIPNWLFVSGFAIAIVVFQWVPEWGRRRLARGLAPLAEHTSEPSLMEKMPGWVVVLIIALAVGVAFYLGRGWPLKVVAWLEELPLVLHEPKILAKVAVATAGVVAVVGGGLGALKKWFRSSGDRPGAIDTDEKT
jgi:hypothetical protein